MGGGACSGPPALRVRPVGLSGTMQRTNRRLTKYGHDIIFRKLVQQAKRELISIFVKTAAVGWRGRGGQA